MKTVDIRLADPAATEQFGFALAAGLAQRGAVIFLYGELGTGKTTLVRAILQKLGITGRVRSPTYTLVESYETAGRAIFHLDLYRLSAAAEAEYLGLRDLDAETDLVLVEWPERGGERLPQPDLSLRLAYEGSGAESGRVMRLDADSPHGTTILSGFAKKYPLI